MKTALTRSHALITLTGLSFAVLSVACTPEQNYSTLGVTEEFAAADVESHEFVSLSEEVVTTTVTIPANQQSTDILFVVDNSGSMIEEQTALADGLGAFITSYLSTLENLCIGMIATDAYRAQATQAVLSPSRRICRKKSDGTLVPQADFINTAKAMVKPGTGGSGAELYVESSLRFFRLNEGYDDKNGVFTATRPSTSLFRQDAQNSIVVVLTDEANQQHASGETTGYGFGTVSLSPVASAQLFKNFFKNLKGFETSFQIFHVFDMVAPEWVNFVDSAGAQGKNLEFIQAFGSIGHAIDIYNTTAIQQLFTLIGQEVSKTNKVVVQDLQHFTNVTTINQVQLSKPAKEGTISAKFIQDGQLIKTLALDGDIVLDTKDMRTLNLTESSSNALTKEATGKTILRVTYNPATLKPAEEEPEEDASAADEEASH